MALSTDFVTSVKRRCNVPTSQVTFQAPDFYALGDEETRSKLLPLIKSQMQRYYITNFDQPVVANQTSYPMPYRAVAMSLEDVMIVSSTDPDTRVGLEMLNPEDLYAGISGNGRSLIKKSGFYIDGNNVILYPKPSQSLDILRMPYLMRPSQLVDPTVCGLITGISGSAISVAVVPSNITTLTTVDFVKANPGFECTAIDQTISSIVSTTINMVVAPPSTLSIGDYVCQSNQSCVVQVPLDLQPLLFQYVVVRILSAQGDQTNLKSAEGELEKLETAAGKLLAPRVSGKPRRVVNARSIARWC